MPLVYQVAKNVLFGGIVALLDVETMAEVDAVVSLVEFGKVPEGIFPICIEDRPHLRIPLGNEDAQGFAQNADLIYDFVRMHSRNSTVLVHCIAGHNRSAAVMLFYLLAKDPDNYTSLEKAVAQLRTINPEIRVNPVYLEFLENYFFSISSTDDS